MLSYSNCIASQIYAVYNRNKTLIIVLAILFTLQIVIFVVVLLFMTRVLGGSRVVPIEPLDKLSSMGEFHGCFLVEYLPKFWLWIPLLPFEGILCLLVVYKAWDIHRVDQINPLFALITRDR